MIYYNIILDLKKDTLKAIEFKNIENARNLKIYLKELDVTDLDMQGVFKQGDNVYVEDGALEDSVFILPLPNLNTGEVEAELILTKERKVIASKTFKYTITDSLSQEFISGIEDKDTLLDKILKTETAETAREASELERTLAEQSRASAETVRESAERGRGLKD